MERNGTDGSSVGRNTGEGNMKVTSNKPPLSLIPRQAMEDMAWAFLDGLIKYAKDDWRQGMDWSEYINAAQRHIAAFNDGEDKAPDTSVSHLGHAMACLAILSVYKETHPELDDRHTKLNIEQLLEKYEAKPGSLKSNKHDCGLFCPVCESPLNKCLCSK